MRPTLKRFRILGVAVLFTMGGAACGSSTVSGSAAAPPATGPRAPATGPASPPTGPTTALTSPASIADASTPPGSGRQVLSPSRNMYPRAVVLHHSGADNGEIIADATSSSAAGTNVGAIYKSTDHGATFTAVTPIVDSAAGSGLCCTTIYSVPRQLGDLAPGTLLWAGSFGANATNRRMSIRVWASSDVGRSWKFVSTAYQSPNTGGLWEPDFEIDTAGELVMQFSDETEQPAHSQFLAETKSTDGAKNWSPPVPTVRSSDKNYRPGMATVQQLPGGSYVMTYEVCGVGGQYDCAVHLRTSPDGWSWGGQNDLGGMPTDSAGEYFAHTPTIVWSPAGGAAGSLLLIGQMLLTSGGGTAPGNGAAYFVNTRGGTGTWQSEPSPVSVPDATNKACPNYSPTLAPYENGTRILEITTDNDAKGTCLAYYASAAAVSGSG